jgi:ion channel-forming bestrophin family protein
MNAGQRYGLTQFLFWTRRDLYWLLLLGGIPVILYEFLGITWIAIPWVPIAMVGTAAAFIVGFKNTQTYNRLWEARQIYGTILNLTRTWGIMVRDYIESKDNDISPEQHELIMRHIAWLTAMRYQLREPRAWENMEKSYNAEYLNYYKIPERETSLENELSKYLSPEDLAYVLTKKNRAAQLLAMQSAQLKVLYGQGLTDTLRFIELGKLLKDFYDQQGKCERIKNFPYPRQFASINFYFIRVFVLLVPLGMLHEFAKLGAHMVWLTIPFSMLVSWIFNSMERVGESTENPFEGNANDVPISAMSRTMEIDLRDMLNEAELPSALQPVNNILM